MADIYTVSFTGTITTAGGNADLWELLPADDKPCKIRGFRLGQTSEVGDSGEEGLRISVLRLLATVTSSNGTVGAPEHVAKSNTTPAFASRTNGATVATSTGATEIVEELSWNVRNSPYEVWYPDPDFAPKCIHGEALLIRLQSTPTDDITFAGTLWVEEG